MSTWKPVPYGEDVEVVEEVDIDEEVSAADLSGESLLPSAEVPEAEPYPELEHTSPRRSWSDPRLALAEEPLGEPTAPQIDAAPAGTRERARRLAPEPPPVEDPTGEAALPDEPELLTPLREEQEPVLSGSIAAVPLIDVLHLLARQQQTGVLTIVGQGRRIEITLQRGQVAQALGTGFDDLRLGRFVVELDAAAPDEVDELASAPTAPRDQPLGARLCQLGYLSKGELRQALARQSQELIYEALRLRAGRFVFTQPEALPRLAVDKAHGADLDLDLEALLLEGYRRIHDWYLVERELSERAVYIRSDDRDPPVPVDRVGLTREEQNVLQLCTGRNAVSDIARDSRLGTLDVVRILRRLQAVNLVRRRLPPQAV